MFSCQEHSDKVALRDSRTKRVKNTGREKTTPLTKVSNVELPKRVGFLTIISWMMMFDTNSVYVFTRVSNLVISLSNETYNFTVKIYESFA